MEQLNKTSNITEAAIVTALATVFVLVGLNIMPLLLLVFPVPFIVLGVRRGLKYSFLSNLVCSIIIGIILGPLIGVFVLIFACVGLPISYLINKKYKTTQIVFGGALYSILAIIIAIVLISFIADMQFVETLEDNLDTFINEYIKTLDTLELQSIQKKEIINLLYTFKNTIILLLPSTLIITSLIMTYINYLISVVILRRLGNKAGRHVEFKYFRLPSNIIPGTFTIVVLTLLIRFLKLNYYETITINVIVILSFVFYTQGLAVVIFYLNKSKLSKFLRTLIILFILFNVSGSIIISVIGFLSAFTSFIKGLSTRNS